MNQFNWKKIAVFASLVAVGVFARVAYQHIPNFAPVAALALFAGYFFSNRIWAICVPMAVMLISDQLVEAGGYSFPLMLTVYGLLAAPVLLRGWLKKHADFSGKAMGSLARVAVCSFGASVIFFLGTNFMVWATTSMYPSTMIGLAECYAAGLAFFYYTLSGDMIFGLSLFGAYAVASQFQRIAIARRTAANA